MDMKLSLSPGLHAGLMEQIASDVALLERCHVMDYSMLLGVRFTAWQPDEWHPPRPKVAKVRPCETASTASGTACMGSDDGAALLEHCHVMESSMLLGVRFTARQPDEWHPPRPKVAKEVRL